MTKWFDNRYWEEINALEAWGVWDPDGWKKSSPEERHRSAMINVAASFVEDSGVWRVKKEYLDIPPSDYTTMPLSGGEYPLQISTTQPLDPHDLYTTAFGSTDITSGQIDQTGYHASYSINKPLWVRTAVMETLNGRGTPFIQDGTSRSDTKQCTGEAYGKMA